MANWTEVFCNCSKMKPINYKEPEMITTQKELRAAFWDQHTSWKRKRVHTNKGTRPATQNEYPAYVRMAWVDFVDHMHRSGEISDALADRATL